MEELAMQVLKVAVAFASIVGLSVSLSFYQGDKKSKGGDSNVSRKVKL